MLVWTLNPQRRPRVLLRPQHSAFWSVSFIFTMDVPPSQTIYVGNLYEKLPKEGPHCPVISAWFRMNV